MGKYTADDNRSMQLNDNNDRYYSSRDIDRDDLFEDEDEDETTTTLEEGIMLLEFNNQIINTQRITHIKGELVDLTLRTVGKEHVVVYPTVRISICTDFRDEPFWMDFTPPKGERDAEDYNSVRSTYNAPEYSCYLPVHETYNVQNSQPACYNPKSGVFNNPIRNYKVASSEEDIRADINETIDVYTRYVLMVMTKMQKNQLGKQ